MVRKVAEALPYAELPISPPLAVALEAAAGALVVAEVAGVTEVMLDCEEAPVAPAADEGAAVEAGHAVVVTEVIAFFAGADPAAPLLEMVFL